MKTQVNGVEIMPEIVNVLNDWNGNSDSWEDTVPYHYIQELGKIQDHLFRMINNVDTLQELQPSISLLVSIKDDLKKFNTFDT